MNCIYQLKQNDISWNNVNYIKPSNYLLSGMDIACEHLIKYYRNDHILCIKYKQGDTQFGLTETSKVWEKNLDDTMIRGINEELNISIDGIQNKYTFLIKKNNIKVYCLQIGTDTDVNMIDDINCTNENDGKKKVLVLIHGNKDIMMAKINKIKSSEKNIIGINLIPVKKIKKIYKFLG